MITLEGYITTFEIALASTDNLESRKDIIDGQSNLIILVNKGYAGESLARK